MNDRIAFYVDLVLPDMVGKVDAESLFAKMERSVYYVENNSNFEAKDTIKIDNRSFLFEEDAGGEHWLRVWFRAGDTDLSLVKSWRADNRWKEFRDNLYNNGLDGLFGRDKEALKSAAYFFREIGLLYDEMTWDELDHVYLRCLFEVDCMVYLIRQSFGEVYGKDFTVTLKISYNKATSGEMESLSYLAVANIVEGGIPRKVPLFLEKFPVTVSGLDSLVQYKPDLTGYEADVAVVSQKGVVHDCMPVCSGWYIHKCFAAFPCKCVECGRNHHFQSCGDQMCEAHYH